MGESSNILNSNSGMNALAGVFQKRMKAVSNSPSVIDVGEIQEDFSLLTNKFPLPIPQSDYMVCRSVMLGAEGDILYRTQEITKENSGFHNHNYSKGAHDHDVTATFVGCGDCSAHTEISGNTSTTGEHDHNDLDETMKHVHDVLIGEKMRWLQAGDRVLVAWIDGADPCVIDLIYPADSLKRNADCYEISGKE